MPASFRANVRYLTKAIDAQSLHVKEFHEDFGSYEVYEYVQYNMPGQKQRITEKVQLGVFAAEEAKKLWVKFCTDGYGEVTA